MSRGMVTPIDTVKQVSIEVSKTEESKQKIWV